jgi:hypothetical protein
LKKADNKALYYLYMYRGVAFFFLAFILASGFALASHGTVHAQIASTNPIDLDIEPQYPAPYQTISITPSSNVFDISGATITATVNGTQIYQGSGGAAIQIPMGGPGSLVKVTIKAKVGGASYSTSVTLQPADVALVVEPVSTTHPFYEGAGLLTSNGRVRVVAIPDLRTSSGKPISPSSLEYTWKFGDQILEDNSGIGKSVLDATAPQEYRDAALTLTVSDPNSSEVAQASTDIAPTDPITRIYFNDPLMGPLFDNALSGTVTMPDAEDTYRGVGYYFSEVPALTWTVNGNTSGNDQDITVRATGNGPGSAVLGFEADQSDTSQTANSTVAVNFGQSQSTGLFGL